MNRLNNYDYKSLNESIQRMNETAWDDFVNSPRMKQIDAETAAWRKANPEPPQVNKTRPTVTRNIKTGRIIRTGGGSTWGGIGKFLKKILKMRGAVRLPSPEEWDAIDNIGSYQGGPADDWSNVTPEWGNPNIKLDPTIRGKYIFT